MNMTRFDELEPHMPHKSRLCLYDFYTGALFNWKS